MRQVLKLYLWGLLVSFLSLVVGLLAFLRDWVPGPGLQVSLSGQQLQPEGPPLLDSAGQASEGGENQLPTTQAQHSD